MLAQGAVERNNLQKKRMLQMAGGQILLYEEIIRYSNSSLHPFYLGHQIRDMDKDSKHSKNFSSICQSVEGWDGAKGVPLSQGGVVPALTLLLARVAETTGVTRRQTRLGVRTKLHAGTSLFSRRDCRACCALLNGGYDRGQTVHQKVHSCLSFLVSSLSFASSAYSTLSTVRCWLSVSLCLCVQLCVSVCATLCLCVSVPVFSVAQVTWFINNGTRFNVSKEITRLDYYESLIRFKNLSSLPKDKPTNDYSIKEPFWLCTAGKTAKSNGLLQLLLSWLVAASLLSIIGSLLSPAQLLSSEQVGIKQRSNSLSYRRHKFYRRKKWGSNSLSYRRTPNTTDRVHARESLFGRRKG